MQIIHFAFAKAVYYLYLYFFFLKSIKLKDLWKVSAADSFKDVFDAVMIVPHLSKTSFTSYAIMLF